MGGISGFYNKDEDFLCKKPYWNGILTSMNNTLINRGPDASITILREKVAFANRELFIKNNNNNNQLFVKFLSNKEYLLSFDGEIYNIPELKAELANLGHLFTSESDSEVIIIGLYHFGVDFLKKMNGTFAIAFWDDSHKSLYLLRDRAGIKPLFFSHKDGYIAFGSEIKVLLKFPNISPEVGVAGLKEVFGLGPARTAGNGVFKGIEEVLPGHFAVFSDNNVKQVKYWDLESREHTDSYDETIEKVRCLISDSLKKQMLTDAPICSFLSGGVDSSIITALASSHLKETTGERLSTFSFDFTGNEMYFKSNSFQPDQDRPWAEKVVKLCDTNHTFLDCNYETLADYLYKAVDAKDLPGMADVDASLLYFCEIIGKDYKVALSGETADEIFGGYPWFHKKEMFDTDAFPWSSNVDIRTFLLNQDLSNTLDLEEYSHSAYLNTINNVPLLEGEDRTEKRRRELAYLNIKWFMSTLIDRLDRTSQYSGLNVRAPFADHRIMEYVFNIPWDIKCRDGVVKHLLRKSSEDVLPMDILYRKKSPFPKTYHPAYEALLSERLRDVLQNKNEPIHNFLDIDKTNLFLNQPSDYGKPWFGQLMAGPQLIAYYLQVNYWMKNYNISLV